MSCVRRSPDLIIEVAHPCITTEYGAYFLQHADYMVCTVYIHVYVFFSRNGTATYVHVARARQYFN